MKRLGILSGNQLAQMMVQAAMSLGIETATLGRFTDNLASRLMHNSDGGRGQLKNPKTSPCMWQV